MVVTFEILDQLKRAAVGRQRRRQIETIEQPCTPSELCATLLKAMGIDTHANLSTSSGRPTRILEANAIDEILS